VTRMYTVAANDQERFCLRLLLLHIPGAASFEDLRTVNGVFYNSFKEAAFQHNLLSSDEEWDRCLEEAATFLMPAQMRQSFAFICALCNPTNARVLWEKYRVDLSMDYRRRQNEEDSFNLALHDIYYVLRQHPCDLVQLNLPEPVGVRIEPNRFDAVSEAEMAEQLILTLNDRQLQSFTRIQRAIDGDNLERCFFLDGPGGSGKTYLYKTLMSFIRGRGQIVLPFATTGIAATLMNGGRTAHSGFKLPVPLIDTSVSGLRQTSPEADEFRQASLIIIDEVTMLPKDGLRCMDQILRDFMGNQDPFGGKVLVIGGDFRQTLPVVPRGSESKIIETCIKPSPLWRYFVSLPLINNMRSEGQNDFNQWLLNIGTGTTLPIERTPCGTVLIPDGMIIQDNIVGAIFGEDIPSLSREELSKRVILCPKNSEALAINNDIIRKLPGNSVTYYSSDEVDSADPSDAVNYPTEFLHSLCPSGMPPHVLTLKRG